MGTERCDGIDWIDMSVNVHVEVSHVKEKNHDKYTDVTEKEQI
jgi:hypothetical protein